MNAVFDRDKARAALGWAEVGPPVQELILDNLQACVRPAPQQIIDRDDLIDHIVNTVWSESEESATAGEVADGIIARLRPVEGVVLTHEEVAEVLMWKRSYDRHYGSDVADDSLHERLEAAS